MLCETTYVFSCLSWLNIGQGVFIHFYGQGQKWTLMDEMDKIFHGQNELALKKHRHFPMRFGECKRPGPLRGCFL